MCACANKVDPVGLKLIDQQKVATDVALTVVCPLPFEVVILPLRTKRRIVGNKPQHHLLESHPIKPPECDKRCQSFRNAFASSTARGSTMRWLAAVFFKIGKQFVSRGKPGATCFHHGA
ncbi:MAG: hypothetical protein FD135_4257 [Comamonadaceae bacterium]|nr:MAG: hypothetical protein FD135_4257 [Comamonadaceae bacterium]